MSSTADDSLARFSPYFIAPTAYACVSCTTSSPPCTTCATDCSALCARSSPEFNPYMTAEAVDWPGFLRFSITPGSAPARRAPGRCNRPGSCGGDAPSRAGTATSRQRSTARVSFKDSAPASATPPTPTASTVTAHPPADHT
eukprot:3333255-Prymnesium_polylepis.2